jgi:hypothetical protein
VESSVVLVISGTVFGTMYKTLVVLTAEGFLVLVIPGNVGSIKEKEGVLAVAVLAVMAMQGTLCAATLAFTGKACGSLKKMVGLILLDREEIV